VLKWLKVLNDLQNRITAAKVGDYKFIKHRYIHRLVFFGVLLLFWETIVRLEFYPRYLLPSPADVVESLYFGFKEADYLLAIFESLRRLCIGYVIAVILGSLAGLAIARYRFLDNSVGASLTALQSIPSVAWVPLALLWFGISEAAVLFIVILEAFIPCALGVRTGVMTIPREIVRAAQTLGSKHIDLYVRVIFPAIIPQFVSSLRLSWAFAWRALIAGELFVSGLGIGQVLELGRSLADMSQVLSMILIIAILGYFSDNVFFRGIERRVNKIWGLQVN
jgi:NitT/TauT family transport system permease protein